MSVSGSTVATSANPLPNQNKEGNAWHEFDILAAVVSRYRLTTVSLSANADFISSIFTTDTKMQHLRNLNHPNIAFHAIDVAIFESGGYYAQDPRVLTHFAGDVLRK